MNYKNEMNELIHALINEGGSDLHISEGRHPTIRVSGMLIPLENKPILTEQDTAGLFAELLSPEQKTKFRESKEIDFSYPYNAYEKNVRFRVNGFVHKGTVGASMRIIPSQIKTLEELNLPPILEDFTAPRQGFFLVVGPVGHGKSTTLASMIEIINVQRAEHIVTIEDPVEYIYTQKRSIISQREVGTDTEDFSVALRSMFRQDVNVVLVGEIRDTATMGTAVTAAETGHLVFSTLHTNNAAQTIDRIIDSFPAHQQAQVRMQLSGSLTAIFSQRLLPRVSGGMIPAFELLINTNAVSNLIRENRTHEISSVIETGLDHGMVSMNRSLAELVRAGEVSIENAKRFSQDPQALMSIV